jgi:hypothetical protein
MISQPIKIEPKSRSTLFYDRYRYAVRGHLKYSLYLRGISHSKLQKTLTGHRGTDPQVAEDLHQFIDFLQDHSGAHNRMVLGWDWWYIYTNDLEFVQKFEQLKPLRLLQYSEAVVDQPRGVIQLNNPSHQMRTYFKEKLLNTSDMQSLTALVESQKDHWKPSPALSWWIKQMKLHNTSRCYTRRYWYIDHQDTKELLFLEMAIPGLVRSTLPIQAK